MFGSGGAGGDLQGSSGLGDEATPAEETSQPPGPSEPPDPGPGHFSPPCPQKPWGPGLLLFPLYPLQVYPGTQTHSHPPLGHCLRHQLVYLGLLVPGKNDIEGFVICKGREKRGSKPGSPQRAPGEVPHNLRAPRTQLTHSVPLQNPPSSNQEISAPSAPPTRLPGPLPTSWPHQVSIPAPYGPQEAARAFFQNTA